MHQPGDGGYLILDIARIPCFKVKPRQVFASSGLLRKVLRLLFGNESPSCHCRFRMPDFACREDDGDSP